MRVIATIFLLKITFLVCYAQHGTDKWLREINIPGNVYPLYGISISPNNNMLLAVGTYGRVYAMDVSSVNQNRQTENYEDKLLWKNTNLTGFLYGSRPEFSPDSKYILLQECNSMRVGATNWNFDKPFSIDFVILDAATGNVVMRENGVNSAAFYTNDQLLIANTRGVKIIDIKTKQEIAFKEIANCEVAAVAHNGKLLAVSYEPSKKDFKQQETIGDNKKELKNALRYKKLISFYSLPDFEKLYTVDEEVDVVYKMKFTADDKELLFYSLNRMAEHQNRNETNIVAQFSSSASTRQQYNLQRIHAQNGKLDRTFYYQTEDWNADFKANSAKTLFGYNQNPGFFTWKRKLNIVDYNKQGNIVAEYLCQGQVGSNNINPINFAFADNDSIIYLAQGLQIIEWNYKRFPNHTKQPEAAYANTLSEAAQTQMHTFMSDNGVLRKQIQKEGITGQYIFDITLHKKGEVATVFAQSDEKTDVKMQNRLKDMVRALRFSVSIPKDTRVKFRYTFEIFE